VESLMPIDELSELFEAERAVRAPSGGAERGLARLAGDWASQAAPMPIATGALKVGGSLVLKGLAVGFGVGVGGAALAAGAWSSTPAAAPARFVAPVAVVASASVASTSLANRERAVPEATISPLAPPTESSRWEPAAPTASPTPAATAETFDAELALIKSAKAELDRGQIARARQLLDEHAARFPTGVFAVDREGLAVLLRCTTLPQPVLARAFADRHPGSAMTERLERACSSATGAVGSTREFPK
jgi:hypothetical protein